MRSSSLRPGAIALGLALCFSALAQTPAAATAAKTPPVLIPRDVLFGNQRASPGLWPDGLKLAWLAPDERDVLQVWVKTVGKDEGKL